MAQDYVKWMEARKVCVIGAGTMGGGIAAHLANLGFEVSLLDLTPESVTAGLERAKSARPPHFYLPETAEKIRKGTIESDLGWVAEADWVCEAIIEKQDAKRALFEAVEPHLRPDAMISTNTSGLQISLLAEGRGEAFRRRFMGTHFFNPPRYLKLLELIPTGETDPEAVRAMARFLEDRVARRVVVAKDTPGFIANRFGMWSMFHAIHVAEKLRLTIEQVDAITGPFLGRPRTGSFRLADLVGLDIMDDIARNLMERCEHDERRFVLRRPKSMEALLERGWLGDKVGQGYYRKEGKELWAMDLSTMAYRMVQEPGLPSIAELGKLSLKERLGKALDLRDEVGEYLREYLPPLLTYADELKEEISHSVLDFDRVMKWGFGWEIGPFETADAIGGEKLGLKVGRYYADGKMRTFAGDYAPIPTEPQYAELSSMPVISEGETLRLRDLGDGVTSIGLTTKMGTISPQVVTELEELLDSGKVKRFVLTSEGRSFSAGFDLNFFLERIQAGDFDAIENALARLQQLGVKLGSIPGCAMIFGHALGGGLELALGCPVIVAAAECKIGFPESRVGLICGGGGAARVRAIMQTEGAKAMAEAAITLTLGTMTSSADEARSKGLIRRTDLTCYLPDRLLWEAKRAALTAEAVNPPEWRIVEGPLAGMIDRMQSELVAKGELTDHDALIGDKIKAVFAKAASFEDALAKERQGFVELCQTGLTLARIKHMLEVGKPLRN